MKQQIAALESRRSPADKASGAWYAYGVDDDGNAIAVLKCDLPKAEAQEPECASLLKPQVGPPPPAPKQK